MQHQRLLQGLRRQQQQPLLPGRGRVRRRSKQQQRRLAAVAGAGSSSSSSSSGSGSSSTSNAGGGRGETLVEFANHRGERLVGTLLEPPSPPSSPPSPAAEAGAQQKPPPPPPVVLLVHGYMSGRDSELLVRLAGALGRGAGVATLRFDLSGNGASAGAFRYARYRDEAAQLACAADFVRRRLRRRVGGVVGHSKGATDALLYAAAACDAAAAAAAAAAACDAAPSSGSPSGGPPPPPCVVNIAGRLDLARGVVVRLGPETLAALERGGGVRMRGRSAARGAFEWTLRKEDVDDRLATDVGAACDALRRAGVPVLTVHGDADADVPVAEARGIAARVGGRHELAVVAGGDHCFSAGASFYELAAAVVPFVAQHAAAAAM